MNNHFANAHTQQSDKDIKTYEKVFSLLLIGFLSVLSISGTIALRNIFLMLLVLMIIWRLLLKPGTLPLAPRKIAGQVPGPVYVWAGFILSSPLWVSHFGDALRPLQGEWLQDVLTFFLAYGAAISLAGRGLSLWTLALTSAVPAFLHLLLTALAWAGVLPGYFFNAPSLWHVVLSVRDFVAGATLWAGVPHPFPVGFRGIEPMHGNIGYPSSQATILACVCALAAWRRKSYALMLKSVLLIVACFASVLIASARGPVLFNLLIVLAAVLSAWLMDVERKKLFSAKSAAIILGSTAVALSLGFASYAVYKDDMRWKSMWDKVYLASMIPNPVETLCNGLSPHVLDDIRLRYQGAGDEYEKALVMGLEAQDGGRILILRAGLQLLLDNPVGLDGSRQSFEKRMRELCGHEPVLPFAHAHNAWLNLGLSLGWLGVLIYASVLLAFVASGLRLIRLGEQRWRGLALVLLAVFWITRGMTDAVFQDHYLLMQAFVLLYLHLAPVGLFPAVDK